MHEAGYFRESASLVESMGRDDRIGAVLKTRVNAILARNGDFKIEATKDGSKEIAARVESWWFDVVPDGVLAGLARSMVMMGVAIARIQWMRMDGEWRPAALEQWHDGNIRWEESLRCYLANTTEGEIPVLQDDPNWLVLEPAGTRSWLGGTVRALGLAYVMRQFNWRDWARFNERHGLPIIAIEEPSGMFSKETKDAFYSSIKRMGSTGIIRLPRADRDNAFDLKFVEPKDRAFQTFESFRANLDIAIAVAGLGQNLATEVQSGSYAAAKAQELVRRDYRRADTEVLATGFRAQLINRWGVFNFPSWSRGLAPWPTWDNRDPVDGKAEAEKLDRAAAAISTLQRTGLPVDYEQLCKQVGIPLVDGADFSEAAAGERIAASARAPDREPTSGPHDHLTVRTSAGDDLAVDSGFVQGQLYADDIVDAGVQATTSELCPLIDRLLEIVGEGGDYESIRRAVIDAYRGHVPADGIRNIVQKAMILAELGGRLAVLQDTAGRDQ